MKETLENLAKLSNKCHVQAIEYAKQAVREAMKDLELPDHKFILGLKDLYKPIVKIKSGGSYSTLELSDHLGIKELCPDVTKNEIEIYNFFEGTPNGVFIRVPKKHYIDEYQIYISKDGRLYDFVYDYNVKSYNNTLRKIRKDCKDRPYCDDDLDDKRLGLEYSGNSYLYMWESWCGKDKFFITALNTIEYLKGKPYKKILENLYEKLRKNTKNLQVTEKIKDLVSKATDELECYKRKVEFVHKVGGRMWYEF